jgi:hypothetical protein
MVVIYDDNETLARALKATMDLMVAEEKTKFALVNLTKLNFDQIKSFENDEIDFVLGYVPIGAIDWLYRDETNYFFQMVTNRKAMFLQQPFDLFSLGKICFQLIYNDIDETEMTLPLFYQIQRTLVGGWLHELQPNKSIAVKKNIMDKVRCEYGFTGNEEEVREYLQKILSFLNAGEINNKIVEGVFCDIEGTLCQGEKVNDIVVDMLIEFENKGKIVKIWTGGNVDFYRQKLVLARINWQIENKYRYMGRIVELVIDDLPREKFIKNFGIIPVEYIKV